MEDMLPFNEQDIHIVYDGKFHFSIHEGRHLSWCYLKILQGTEKTLVLLSQPHGYTGTFIANAMRHIAPQITQSFGLDPNTTIFVHYTPPVVPVMPAVEPQDDFSASLVTLLRSLHGPSDEVYERIAFSQPAEPPDTQEPMLKRYYTGTEPYWEALLPAEAAKLLPTLNQP